MVTHTISFRAAITRYMLMLPVAVLINFSAAYTTQAQWINKYNSTNDGYVPKSGQRTVDGGYVVAGIVNDRTTNSPKGGGLIKLKSNGALEWQKSVAGTGNDVNNGFFDIQQTSDGGYVLPSVYSSPSTVDNAAVLKLNFDGTLAWWRRFALPQHTNGAGDLRIQNLTSIQPTLDGGYVAAGFAAQHSGYIYIEVFKLNANGMPQWTRVYDTGNVSISGNPHIQQTFDGGYIVAGSKYSPYYSPFGPISGDGYALKLNPDGSVAWLNFFTQDPKNYTETPVAPSCGIEINSVQQTSDTGYFLSGRHYCTGGAFALKLKPNGSIDWQMAYKGDVAFTSLSSQQTSDGGYVLAGFLQGQANYGPWLLKVDADGSVSWQRSRQSGSPIIDAIVSIQQTVGGGYKAVALNGSAGAHVFSLDGNGNVAGCNLGVVSAMATPTTLSALDARTAPILAGNSSQLNPVVESLNATVANIDFTTETLCGVLPAQLEMTKTASPNPTVGQDLTYTITIKNKGPGIAQAVTFTDPLPSSVTFVSVNSTQGTCSTGNPVTCNIGDLADAGTATVTLVVRPNSEGQLSNLATVSGTNSASVQASASSTVAQAAKTVQFNATSYSIGEGSQRIDINVTRSGDASAAASVNFATNDNSGTNNCNVMNGNASSRCDYLSAFGTVNFAAGETSKTISLLITDDAYAEGPETLTLALSNPSGAALGSPSSVIVTIADNETANGSNPIDQAGFFVDQHYGDFLNRLSDPSGRAFWINEITTCGANQSCIEAKRINVSAAYFLSIEFQQTGYFVERMYKAAYGDASGTSVIGGTHQLPVPVVRYREFLLDTQQIGQGVIVGQSGWETVLENNKQTFAGDFVQRSRFTTALPTTLTPAQFVDKLFLNAGVTPSSTDRNAAIAEFGSAGNTANAAARGRALRRVAENSTLVANEFNRAFVLMQFVGYLRRNPNDAPDTDYSGYEFWLSKLNQFNGNFVAAEMVKAFIISIEYRSRFGP